MKNKGIGRIIILVSALIGIIAGWFAISNRPGRKASLTQTLRVNNITAQAKQDIQYEKNNKGIGRIIFLVSALIGIIVGGFAIADKLGGQTSPTQVSQIDAIITQTEQDIQYEKYNITLRCPYQDIILDGGFHHVSGEQAPEFVPIPTREGYIFDGFIDHLNQVVFLSDGRRAFTGRWFMTSDHDLRATWREIFRITLRCPYQDIILDGGFHHVSGEQAPEFVPIPTREGYIFDGFFDHSGQRIFNDDGSRAFNGTLSLTQNQTLRATWREIFRITLRCPYQDIILDGGFHHVSGEQAPEFVPIPTREGYIFDGFIDRLNQVVFLSDGRRAFTGRWFMTSDHDLRATWRDAEQT